MGIKQSIVVVNEYTIRNSSGKGGSRGGTPGAYVVRYMARDKATETLTPVRLTDQEDYVMRYMARAEAVDKTITDRDEVKPEFQKMQKYGGVAFGYGSISLSDEALEDASKDIQKNFDEGKTVLKTVLSFEEEYLREMGVISDDFVCTKRGDYRGNIDQMKLRMAIMNGMDKLADDYSDLQYIGVIQVDTMHVHCHLAMVDRGTGMIMPDGTQKGKISALQKAKLRRGIDMALDDSKAIQHMASNVDMDKRNTAMFVKRVSHRTMAQNGFGQLLVASLPEDKRLWRAGTNNKQMERANNLTREYVRAVFDQEDSGYQQVVRQIYEYAQARKDREDLSDERFRQLVNRGKKQVEDDCINAVYSTLQLVESKEKTVRTPMLDLMAAPARDIGKDADELGEFTYKLRSYNTRLGYHRKERDKAHKICENYKKAQKDGKVSQDAAPAIDFFRFEEDYNEQLMCKYLHFLDFLPPDEEYMEDLDDLLDYKDMTGKLDSMFRDRSIRRMKADNAEEYGREVYGQNGGRFMTFAPDIIEERLRIAQETLEQKDMDFNYKLCTYGLEHNDETGKVEKHIKYDFDEVKALDIHHLTYDSPSAMQVSSNNVEKFVETARKRADLAEKAKAYFEASGQPEAVDEMNLTDIRLMTMMADELESTHKVRSVRVDKTFIHPSPTVTLDRRLNMDLVVQQSLREIDIEDEMQYGG